MRPKTSLEYIPRISNFAYDDGVILDHRFFGVICRGNYGASTTQRNAQGFLFQKACTLLLLLSLLSSERPVATGGGSLSNCCCFQIFVMNILNIKGLPRCDNWTIAYFIFHISIEVYNLIDSNVVVHLWLGYTLHFSPFSPCSAISGVIAVHTKVENYYCCCC